MHPQQVAIWEKRIGCKSHNLLQLVVRAGGGTGVVLWGESLPEEQLERDILAELGIDDPYANEQ